MGGYGVVRDPTDNAASKHGLVIREFQSEADWFGPLFSPEDEGEVLFVAFAVADAKTFIKWYELQHSWLYIHRYRATLWAMAAVAVAAVPWEHYVNHDPWQEAPLWVLAFWAFFGAIVWVAVEVFWPKPLQWIERSCWSGTGTPSAFRLNSRTHRVYRRHAPRCVSSMADAAEQAGRFNLGNVSCLSERELRVAKLFADGLTNREIAARLNVTETWVKINVLRIYEKLRIDARSDFKGAFEEHAGRLPMQGKGLDRLMR